MALLAGAAPRCPDGGSCSTPSAYYRSLSTILVVIARMPFLRDIDAVRGRFNPLLIWRLLEYVATQRGGRYDVGDHWFAARTCGTHLDDGDPHRLRRPSKIKALLPYLREACAQTDGS